jgi:PAS domain S-box-containing protein
VIRVDAEARIVFVNEACCQNLDYTREELLELSVFDINPNFPKEGWADHWNNLRTLKSMSLESALRRKDGHIFPIELSLNYLLYGGHEYSFAIARDITERKKRDAAMQLLSTRLLQLQDEERRRIARDLHDVTAQDLGAVVVNLAHLRLVATDLKPEAQGIVTESVSLAEQVLQQIRTLSYLLHPPMLDEAGLASALRWFIEGFTKRSGISVDLEVASEIGRMSLEIETALFRIMQESLTNIHRHSGSGGAQVRLIKNEGTVALYVKDQGSGMLDEAAGETIDSVQSLGLGILGMRQRLRQFGGKLEIETSKHGTEIRATVPVAGW